MLDLERRVLTPNDPVMFLLGSESLFTGRFDPRLRLAVSGEASPSETPPPDCSACERVNEWL